MPPAAKRNRCVVLYDLNSKNQRQIRLALFKVYAFYYFRKSKNLVSLVLINSDKTGNRRHARCGKGYDHILEVNNEELPFDPTYIYEKIEVKNAEASNWKEAIRVAIQILQEDNIKNIITKQILFLTDLSCSSPSNENLNDIRSDLAQSNIFLYIVGPQVEYSKSGYPKSITSLTEIHSVMLDASFMEKNDNLQEAKILIDQIDTAVIADIKRGLELFFNFLHPIGKQRWPVPLTFGSKIALPIGTSKFLEKYKGLKLQCKYKPTYNTSLIFTSAEDSTKVYNDDDIRKGISRHGKFIALQNNDMFKPSYERMFSVVFITETKNIPEYMMKGPACYSVSEDSNVPPHAFRCLLSRLNDRKCCIIVKRVYNKGNTPIYVALLPNITKNYFKCVQLPFASQVPFEYSEYKPVKNEKEVPDDVTNYLDSITLNSPNFRLNHTLTPNVVRMPRDNNLLNSALRKLLHEKLDMEQVDYDVFATGISEKVGKDLREAWPSRTQVKLEDVKDSDGESDNEDEYF